MTSTRNGQTVDVVYQILKDRIADGTYGPGIRLPQIQVATDLNVSRTPLREAFQRLEREGFVVSEANRSVVVAPLSVSDVEDSYAVRILVEPHALASTIPLVTDDDIARMERALWEMSRDSLSTKDFQFWHKKYHNVLLEKYPQPFGDLTRSLITHIDRHQAVYFTRPLALEDVTEVDRMFLDAVRRHDVDSARALLQFHLIDAALGIVRTSAPEHTFVPLLAAIEGTGFEFAGITDGRCLDRLHLPVSDSLPPLLHGLSTTNVFAG
ncbi:GntR family transcriptional regulator [Rhodococcus globerulus]|uniref:GntR family transcriptional regulator n=1 Tax=Rhodococcus globerulus TaxID=33008 RepID=UPI00068CAE66|nr:GntR family transcriptional regulator [Rhodococcus globerulus]PVX59529.1 GntR family transcriptional regulator [Rhodococcus globerulus]